MPCDSGPSYEDTRLEREARNQQARAACEMAEVITARNLFGALSIATQEWILAHREYDQRRKQNEERQEAERLMIQEARGKLSADEIRALGI